MTQSPSSPVRQHRTESALMLARAGLKQAQRAERRAHREVVRAQQQVDALLERLGRTRGSPEGA